MFTNSIRWRLQLWLAFLLACVLSGFGITVHQLQKINQFNQIDEDLAHRVAALDTALRWHPRFGPPQGSPPGDARPGLPNFGFDGETNRPPPPFGRPDGPPPGGGRGMRPRPREFKITPVISSLFDESQTNGFYFAVWSRDGSPIKISTNAPPKVPVPGRIEDTRIQSRMRDEFRESFHFTEMGDCVLAGRSIAADLESMSRFTWWLLAAGSAVLALGLGGGWWLTTSAIRPVERISAAASRISAGNLSERISGADADNELGRLAGVLNSTFARLEAAFAQQKQFTADASHELRTPLAVIISEAQTTLARERSAPEYRETVETCLEAAQQMRRLTQSLLDLARVESGQEELERGSLELAGRARICVERLQVLALQHEVRIECELAAAPTVGNADRLDQVITNLLANAIYYNRPGGEVRVSTRKEDGFAVLVVNDTGQGIAAADVPHIFERFYRADKSRSRAEGRSGLGLAICKAIVDAEGGAIEVASQPGVGSTFTVRLPRVAPIQGAES